MRSASESHATRQRLASHVDVEVDAEPTDVALTTFAPPSGATKTPRSRKARVSAESSEDGGAQRTGSPTARRPRGTRKTTRGGRGFGAAAPTLRRRTLDENEENGDRLSVIPVALTRNAPAQDGAIVWGFGSPVPSERGTAGRRFASLLPRFDHDELLHALFEYAVVPDPSGAVHHAIGFTDLIARHFTATIRERWRDEEKTEERVQSFNSGGLRSISAILAGAR